MSPRNETSEVDPRRQWGTTVEGLAEALSNASDIMAIFGPEAHKQVHFYAVTEAVIYDKETGRPPTPLDVFTNADAEVNVDEIGLPSQFKTALAQLDEFIRANFKPEEIFAAQKGLCNQWPHPFRFCHEYWLTID